MLPRRLGDPSNEARRSSGEELSVRAGPPMWRRHRMLPHTACSVRAYRLQGSATRRAASLPPCHSRRPQAWAASTTVQLVARVCTRCGLRSARCRSCRRATRRERRRGTTPGQDGFLNSGRRTSARRCLASQALALRGAQSSPSAGRDGRATLLRSARSCGIRRRERI